MDDEHEVIQPPPPPMHDARLRDVAERIRSNHAVLESVQRQVDSDVRDILAHVLYTFRISAQCSADGTVSLRNYARLGSDNGAEAVIHLFGNRALLLILQQIVGMLARMGRTSDHAHAVRLLTMLKDTIPWPLGGDRRGD